MRVRAIRSACWLKTAARLLRPRGTVTLIWRADGLADVLGALAPGFGAVTVLPVHPKPAEPAIRVLVRATKASRAPLAVLPGLVLNDRAGHPTRDAEAVLRAGPRCRWRKLSYARCTVPRVGTRSLDGQVNRLRLDHCAAGRAVGANSPARRRMTAQLLSRARTPRRARDQASCWGDFCSELKCESAAIALISTISK